MYQTNCKIFLEHEGRKYSRVLKLASHISIYLYIEKNRRSWLQRSKVVMVSFSLNKISIICCSLVINGVSSLLYLQDQLGKLVQDLTNPNTKESALLELSKKRESFPELAPYLWHSFGTMAALLQEIVSIYPMLQPPSLTAHASNRVCNALALLQCVASHPETRSLFLKGENTQQQQQLSFKLFSNLCTIAYRYQFNTRTI